MSGRDEIREDGMALFRELKRHFPMAKVEDYFKNGAWLKDLLVIDNELTVAHRRASGAPEPLPIEDIDIPKLPGGFGGAVGKPQPPAHAPPATGSAVSRFAPPARPAAPARQAGIQSKPLMPTSLTRPTFSPAIGASTGRVATNGGGGGVASELSKIALFVKKWNLEPTRTKLLLARLTPLRRQAVIEKFRASEGGNGTSALEQYIQANEQSGSGYPTGTGGAKRPSNGSEPQTDKRPRYGSSPTPYGSTSGSSALRSPSGGGGASRAPVGATRPSTALSPQPPSSRATTSLAKPASRVPVGATRPSTTSRPQPPSRAAASSAKPASSMINRQPGDLIKSLLGGL